MRAFSRLRWLVLCLCGLRHREPWYITRQGHAPKRSNRCTRCGLLEAGKVAL